MKSRPDIRDVIRNFAPESQDPRLLRWASVLDAENGAGVRVALLDAGIFWMHPAFQGAELQVRDFTGHPGAVDPTGHGTKNAALLVAQGHDCLRGLIPASTLMVGKVLANGSTDNSARALAQAIRWAVSKGADIVILPLGRARGSTLVVKEIHCALKAGCLIFAAAGNRGPENFLFPARLAGVKAVSAAGPDGKPLDWCCQASQVDCYAPGLEVWSIGLEGHGPISGSSPATVLAAGVAALQLARERRLNNERGEES